MSPVALAAFSARATAQRQRLFAPGSPPVVYAGVTYCAPSTTITSARQIEAGGFEQLPACIVRVSVAEHPKWAAALGKAPAYREAVGTLIKVGGDTYKINEVKGVALSGEIILALGKP